MEKSIDVPGPVAQNQNAQPFALGLGITNSQPVDLGIFASASLNAPYEAPALLQSSRQYAISLENWQPRTYSPYVEAENSQVFGIHVHAANEQNWKRWLGGESIQPLLYGVDQAIINGFSLRAVVKAQNAKTYSQIETVTADNKRPWQLLLFNPAQNCKRSYWDLGDIGALQNLLPPEILLDGLPMACTGLTIKSELDHFAWTAEIILADESQWQRLQLDRQFTLTVDGESFTLLVDSRSSLRDGSGQNRRVVTAASPLASYAAPRTTPEAKSWQEDVKARDVVAELLGDSVAWQQVDWTISAGRLDYTAQTPMQTAWQVVAAAGGVINSNPDGSARVIPRCNIPVSQWEQATPDHVLTDSADNLTIREQSQSRKLIDKITVHDHDPERADGFLALELDRRRNGPNRGRRDFRPGETAHLLVTPGPDVAVAATPTPSAAEIIATGAVRYASTEQLAFINANQARLPRPMEAIDQYTWLGRNLGAPQLASDGMTVTVPNSGTAILEVTGETAGYGYQFKAPHELQGQESFPVAFSSLGTATQTSGSASAMRNNGSRPGRDIVVPLLNGKASLLARCRQELDRNEVSQEVEVTALYRPGVAPGQLVEIHDSNYGRTFRGQIKALTHEINQDTQTSRLTINRQTVS